MFPFQSNFPFKDGIDKWMKNAVQGNHIEKYVQDSISKSFANPLDIFEKGEGLTNRVFEEGHENQRNEGESTIQTNSRKIDPQIFESHDDVFVKIRIKDAATLKEIKVFHTSNQVIIEDESRHVFPLPSIVKKKGATTSYKDGILQITIPKAVDMQYTEIDVPHVE